MTRENGRGRIVLCSLAGVGCFLNWLQYVRVELREGRNAEIAGD